MDVTYLRIQIEGFTNTTQEGSPNTNGRIHKYDIAWMHIYKLKDLQIQKTWDSQIQIAGFTNKTKQGLANANYRIHKTT